MSLQMAPYINSHEGINRFDTLFDKIQKNLLVSIDSDYKFVTNNFLAKNSVEKILKTYYPNSVIEIYYLSEQAYMMLEQILYPNSFLKTNDFDPNELIQKLGLFDEIINYFSKIDKTINWNDLFLKKLDKKEENNLIIQKDKTEFNISSRLQNIFVDLRYSDSRKNSEKEINLDENKYLASNSLNDDLHGTPNWINLEYFNESLLQNETTYNFYFNSQFNNLIMIPISSDYLSNPKFKLYLSEMIFISNEKLNESQIKQLSTLKDEIFVDLNDAKNLLNRILHDKIIDSKLSIDEIKNLMTKYFVFDNNPEHCIKFTNIWSIISSEIKVTESLENYIKRQLPIIFKDMGLQKKRLSDGIYWYGLVKKNIVDKTEPNNNLSLLDETQLLNIDISQIINQRNQDIETIYSNNKLSGQYVNFPKSEIILKPFLSENNKENQENNKFVETQILPQINDNQVNISSDISKIIKRNKSNK